MKKDGYRIESSTYEGLPGKRIPALIMIPDGVTASNPAPGIAVWQQVKDCFALHLQKG